jgi:uncharacterized damage-inducible protein DinB
MTVPADSGSLGAHAELSDRLLRMYPEEIRACLAELDDEQIWWRPNASSNSVGNMVIHLTGNLNHYLGHGAAGSTYRRDRPAEFAETGPIPRQELLDRFEASLEWARRGFERATPDRWLEMADLGPESMPLGQLLVAVTAHFSGHVGQIIYVTKMIRAGVFEDLWKRVRDR